MRRIVVRAAAAVLAVAPGARAAAPPPPAPMTFEEVLSEQRAVRGAWVSPAGDAVLVSVERNDRPTGGAPWKLTGTQALIAPLAGAGPTTIGDPDGAFLPSPCEPWSPSGRFVAGFVLAGGRKALAVYDRRQGRLVRFTASPTVQCVRWAGERLVFPTAGATAPTLGGSAKVAARRQLARWDAAWSRPAPQVTVHSSNPAVAGSAAPAGGGLVLADPRTGAATLLAAGAFHSVTPAPDGRRVAAARYGADDPDALSTRTGRRSQLELFEITATGGRSLGRLPGFDVDYASLVWSPDGAQILAVARPVGQRRAGLVAVEAASGRPTDIALPAGLTLARAPAGAYSRYRPGGWIGRSPAFLAVRAGDGRSEAGGGDARPSPAARLYAWSGGAVVPLADDAPPAGAAFAGGTDTALFVAGGRLWSAAPGAAARSRSPPDLKVIGLAEARPSLGLAPAWAVSARRAAVKVEAATGVRTVVLDLATGRPALDAGEALALAPGLDDAVRRERHGWSSVLVAASRAGPLLTLNGGWRDRPVARTEAFTYEVGGRPLRGWIVHPTARTTTPPPALLWIYGGQRQGASAPREALPAYAGPPVFSAQLWAAHGYAVIYPSTPLPEGAAGDMPDALAQAAVAAVDAAAARAWVDPARVGIIGHSFGGFSAAAVLARRSDRFAAGVAMSGDYDYAAAWGLRGLWDWMQDGESHGFREATVGQVEAGQIGLGAPPFAAPEAYRRASPFYAADRIRAPLLLTVGDLEPGATGLAQAERFYAALKRNGNPAVLVRYWGQGHVQDDPGAVADQWRRFTGWFDHYLGANPAPSSADLKPGRESSSP